MSGGAATSGETVEVHFTDSEVAVGRTPGVDLDRTHFELVLTDASGTSDGAIVPLASVKRVVLRRTAVREAIPGDVARKVALHFWDGEVLTGLMRDGPTRGEHGMTVELVAASGDTAEVYALPYHALKAVFFLRSWDTRAPHVVGIERRGTAASRREAPLIALLSEIRGLRGLRHRGQISAVEYERRRSQVLERI